MSDITDPWLRLHYESGQVPMKDIREVFRTAGYDVAPGAAPGDLDSWRKLEELYHSLHPADAMARAWEAFRDATNRLGYRPALINGKHEEDTTEGFGGATELTEAYVGELHPRAEARERIVGQTLTTLQWESVPGESQAGRSAGQALPPVFQGDVGVDLSTVVRTVINPGSVTYVPLGVKFAAPPGAWILLVGRSSLASKLGLAMVPGVIDNGFRGEMLAGLYPIGHAPVTLPMGTRVAQAILIPMFPTHLVQALEGLPTSDRGENGFGSTGER